MRTITKTEIIIRLVFFICIVSAGLIASIVEDTKVTQKVTARQNQEMATFIYNTPDK